MYSRVSLCVAAALVAALPVSLHAEIIGNPAVVTSATPFNGSFAATNVFDSNTTEYASQGQGANTFIDFDFGAARRLDGFAFANRNSQHVDRIAAFNLVFSQNATFGDADDVVHSFANGPTALNESAGLIYTFEATTARFVRWDVTNITGATVFNQGATEMRFLNSEDNAQQITPTIIAGSTPFNANYALNNAIDGFVGWGTGLQNPEYASAGQGNNTFIDFDFGSVVPLIGFDLFQRLAIGDHFTSFNLLFSNDPLFANLLATRSYTITGDGDNWTETDLFASINARYVRFDVTAGSAANAGLSEVQFFVQTPEPASLALWAVVGSLGIAYGARRRKAAAR